MSHPQTEIAIENLRSRGERITGPSLSKEVQRLDDAVERAYREAGLRRGFLANLNASRQTWN